MVMVGVRVRLLLGLDPIGFGDMHQCRHSGLGLGFGLGLRLGTDG